MEPTNGRNLSEWEDEKAGTNLANHVTVVVITQGTAELLIVHMRLILALAPKLGHHLWIV